MRVEKSNHFFNTPSNGQKGEGTSNSSPVTTSDQNSTIKKVTQDRVSHAGINSQSNGNSIDLIQQQKNKFEQNITDCNEAHSKYVEFSTLFENIIKNNPDLNNQTVRTPISANQNDYIDKEGKNIIEENNNLIKSFFNWCNLVLRLNKTKLQNLNSSSCSSKTEDSNINNKKEPDSSGKKGPDSSNKIKIILTFSFILLPALKKLLENSNESENFNKALISLLSSIAKPFSQLQFLIDNPSTILNHLKEDFINDTKGADIIIALLPIFINKCTVEEMTTLSSLILSDKSRSYLSTESIQSFEAMKSEWEHNITNTFLDALYKY